MPPTKPKASLQQTNTFLALMALGLWLLTRAYYGIWHDAVFYSLIALNQLQPNLYCHDLFFLYGSQSSYTLFIPFLAWWIKSFGLDNGLLWATVLGQVLWLSALIWLVTGLLPRRMWAFSFLAVALFPPYYTQMTSYGEPFVTPRLYSEVLVLFGLGALLRRHGWLAWPSLIFSMMIHPLIGLPGVGIALLHKIRQPRVWFALIIVGGAIMLGLIHNKLGPFSTMGQVLPPDLVRFEQQHSPWLFLNLWPWANLSTAFYTLIILALATRHLDYSLARLARLALLIALIGISVALLAKFSDYAFLLGLQTNRALWLTQLLAVILWFPVASRLWQNGKNGEHVVILLACGALGVPVLMAPMALLALAYQWGGRHIAVLHSPSRFIQMIVWLFPLQVLIWSLLNARLIFETRGIFELRPIGLVLMGEVLPLALAAGFLLWLYHARARKGLELGLAIAAVATLTMALFHWDLRLYTRPANTPTRQRLIIPLQKLIPIGAVVYWEEGPRQAWFWLQRANYVSTLQLAGTIFTPQTAIEGMRRMRLLDIAGFPDSSWTFDKPVDASRIDKVHDLASVTQVCSDPIIHTLILKNPVPGLSSEYAFVDTNNGKHYYAYPCRTILATSIRQVRHTPSVKSMTHARNR